MIEMILYEERCKGCGLCRDACPHDLMTLSTKINALGFQTIAMTDPAACTCTGLPPARLPTTNSVRLSKPCAHR